MLYSKLHQSEAVKQGSRWVVKHRTTFSGDPSSINRASNLKETNMFLQLYLFARFFFFFLVSFPLYLQFHRAALSSSFFFFFFSDKISRCRRSRVKCSWVKCGPAFGCLRVSARPASGEASESSSPVRTLSMCQNQGCELSPPPPPPHTPKTPDELGFGVRPSHWRALLREGVISAGLTNICPRLHIQCHQIYIQ